MADTRLNPELPPGVAQQTATIEREEYMRIATSMWKALLSQLDVMDALVVVEALFRTSACQVLNLGRGGDGLPPNSFIASANYAFVMGCVEKLRADLATLKPKAH